MNSIGFGIKGLQSVLDDLRLEPMTPSVRP